MFFIKQSLLGYHGTGIFLKEKSQRHFYVARRIFRKEKKHIILGYRKKNRYDIQMLQMIFLKEKINPFIDGNELILNKRMTINFYSPLICLSNTGCLCLILIIEIIEIKHILLLNVFLCIVIKRRLLLIALLNTFQTFSINRSPFKRLIMRHPF